MYIDSKHVGQKVYGRFLTILRSSNVGIGPSLVVWYTIRRYRICEEHMANTLYKDWGATDWDM